MLGGDFYKLRAGELFIDCERGEMRNGIRVDCHPRTPRNIRLKSDRAPLDKRAAVVICLRRV